MKVLGISFGRVNGNDEVLVKEALRGAQEVGAEVELIRFNDFKVKPCIACNVCSQRLRQGKPGNCIHDDDFPLLEDRIYAADGIIFSSPIYIWGPTGGFRNLCDRFGPSHDVAFLRRDGLQREDSPLDQRIFNHRVAGLIAVGGTTNPNYATMGLSLMPMVTHSMQIDVVDQLMCLDTDQLGKVFKHQDKIDRAHQLGKNVALSCGVPREELKWYAEDGVCPCCHNDLFTYNNGDDFVSCCTCAIDGKIEYDENGKMRFAFSADDVAHPRKSEREMLSHGEEISAQMADWFARKDELTPKMEKYRNYKVKLIKPEKKA